MDSNVDMRSYRRKSIIKTVAIVFLAVLLVLTFFSQTIMNYSLPEVSAQYASAGTITTRVRASGTVEANQNYEVRSGSTRTIREVLIRQGDTVSVGDPLFRLEDVESEEVKTAQNAVKEAEKAIKDAEKAIRDAEKGVASAQAAYESSLRDVNPATSTAVLVVEKAKQDLDAAKKKLNSVGNYDAQIAAAEAALDSAQAYVRQLTREQNDLTKQKQKLQEKLSAVSDSELTDLTLEQRLAKAEADFSEAKQAFEDAEFLLEAAKQQKDQSDIDKENADDALAAANDRKTEYEAEHGKITAPTDDELLAAKRNIEALELAYQRALEDYNYFVQGQQLSRNNTEMTLVEARNTYLSSNVSNIDQLYAECFLNYYLANMQNDILTGQKGYYNTVLTAYDLSYLTRQEYQTKLDNIDSQLSSISSKLSSLASELQSLTAQWDANYNKIQVIVDVITHSDSETTAAETTSPEPTMPTPSTGGGTTGSSTGSTTSDSFSNTDYSKALTARITFERAVNSYISALSQLEKDNIAQLRALEDKEIELDQKKQDYEKLENNKIADPVVKQITDSVKQAEAAQKAAVKAQTQAQNELTRATEKHAEAKTKLTEAEQKLKDMRGLTNNETVQAQIDALDIKIDGYAAKLDAANDDVSKKQEALTTLKSENITEEQARSNYNTAQQAYLSAQQALYNENQEVSEKKAAIDDASDALDDAKDNLADKEAALADRQKELDKAVADSTDTTVKAPIAGTISNVSVTAGSKTEAAQTMCTIFVSDQGYKVTFTVTREQANRIHVGDEARAQYFWGGECQASVAAIKPDPSNAQQRIVDLNVSGDVTVGQTMTFTLGDRSAEYDTVVPNSAIREDRNGKYVLVVESRSTPLGTRYTAVRVDVQVAASDETQSALSTSLYGNEFIITASTKPINAGDLVRLVNN